MSRVTKDAAKRTAKIMAENAMNEKISSVQTEIKSIIQPYADKLIPSEIATLYSNVKFKHYFRVDNGFIVSCGELRCYDRIYLKNSIPGDWSEIEVSKVDFDKYNTLNLELKDLVDEKDFLRRKIEATLLSLKTYKGIQKEFPEAYICIPEGYIDSETITTVALPIEDLKFQLLKYKAS